MPTKQPDYMHKHVCIYTVVIAVIFKGLAMFQALCCFICIFSLNLYKNLMSDLLLLYSFEKLGNRGPEVNLLASRTGI